MVAIEAETCGYKHTNNKTHEVCRPCQFIMIYYVTLLLYTILQ